MFTVVILLLFITIAQADKCDDLDTSLCDLMVNRIPGMCGDPCVSKICKRSCRLCALQCYQCTEVKDVSNCSTMTTCQLKDDYCFVAQTFTSHFTEAYILGCGDRQTCLQYSTRRVNLEAGCCNTDQCNNKPPPLLKIIPAHNYTSPIPTTNPNECVNIDDDICTRLAIHLQNPCSDDCIATKLCPHMCKKCFYCLDCNEVPHPDNCTKTIACGYDKECYGLEKLGSNFLPAVQLGCIDQKICQTLQTPSGHVFGKRAFTFTGSCCIGDKCNVHSVAHNVAHTVAHTGAPSSVSPPTTATNCHHHSHTCPPHFHLYDSKCFLFGKSKFSKAHAQKFCEDHCSDLFYFNFTNTDLRILHAFQNSYREVYTDMLKISHHTWVWHHDYSPVAHSVLNYKFSSHGPYACATVSYHYDRFHRTFSYDVKPVDCTDEHYPLCMIKLS